MDRRTFVGACTGALVQSVAAQAPVKVYRVGFFLGASGDSVKSLFDAFSAGLRDLGYVEGRNVIFERGTQTATWTGCRKLQLSWCASGLM